MEDVSIPLVSYEISEEEEDKNDCSIIKLKNKTQKKILVSNLRNFYKCHKIWSVKWSNSVLSNYILADLEF